MYVLSKIVGRRGVSGRDGVCGGSRVVRCNMLVAEWLSPYG